ELPTIPGRDVDAEAVRIVSCGGNEDLGWIWWSTRVVVTEAERELFALQIKAHGRGNAGDAPRVRSSEDVDKIALFSALGVDAAEAIVTGKVCPDGATHETAVLLGQTIAQELRRRCQKASGHRGDTAKLANKQRPTERARLGERQGVIVGDGAGVTVVLQVRAAAGLRIEMRGVHDVRPHRLDERR